MPPPGSRLVDGRRDRGARFAAEADAPPLALLRSFDADAEPAELAPSDRDDGVDRAVPNDQLGVIRCGS
jgi:hypothetical protein